MKRSLSRYILCSSDIKYSDGNTSGAVNAATVTTLTGAAAAMNTAYASNGITGLANEAITLDDTTLAVATLNTLDGNTSGAINAATVTTLIGAAAAMNTAYASNGIGLANEAITLDDTTLAATVLNTLDGNTTGIVNASSVATLTGLAADVNTTYVANTAGTISGLSNEAVTISDTTIGADVLNTLNGYTTGVVNASSVTTPDGTFDDVNTSYAGNTASTISGLGNEAVTLTDLSISATNLSSIDALTSGIVTASATTITGTYTELNSVYTANAAGTVAGLGNEAITASGSLTVAQVNTLAGYTTGVLTATVSDNDMSTLNGITESGHSLTISVTDGSVAASNLNTPDSKTTVAVGVTSSTITGNASDVNAAYAADALGTISGLGDEAVTFSDTTLAADVLNTVNAYTRIVNVYCITLTGAFIDVNTAYAADTAGTISGLGMKL